MDGMIAQLAEGEPKRLRANPRRREDGAGRAYGLHAPT